MLKEASAITRAYLEAVKGLVIVISSSFWKLTKAYFKHMTNVIRK